MQVPGGIQGKPGHRTFMSCHSSPWWVWPCPLSLILWGTCVRLRVLGDFPGGQNSGHIPIPCKPLAVPVGSDQGHIWANSPKRNSGVTRKCWEIYHLTIQNNKCQNRCALSIKVRRFNCMTNDKITDCKLSMSNIPKLHVDEAKME